MSSTNGRRARQRGSIQQLPSGSLRVRVYAGLDASTGARHYLTEVVPAGPKAAAEAERACTRLLNQVDEQRNPKTRATLNQLLDAYMEVTWTSSRPPGSGTSSTCAGCGQFWASCR